MYHVTYVDEFSLVASLEFVEHGGLDQIRQVRHDLTLLKLRWIHLKFRTKKITIPLINLNLHVMILKLPKCDIFDRILIFLIFTP
jgi:hypothetical protein